MNIETVLSELKRPFHPTRVTWKPGMVSKDQGKALALAYADLRAYQNRLDEICGMDWSVTYTPWGDRLVCHLTIAGVTRSSTGESDAQSERSEIGGTAMEAQAFKRACAMFGLGRYLYNLPSVWVEYDAGAKQFTDKAKAKLESIIVQHYRRTVTEGSDSVEPSAEKKAAAAQAASVVAAAQGVAVETVERLRQELDQLGLACYGEQWPQVCRHNAERISGGKAIDAGALTVEQLNRLIDGMKKLQGKRQTAK